MSVGALPSIFSLMASSAISMVQPSVAPKLRQHRHVPAKNKPVISSLVVHRPSSIGRSTILPPSPRSAKCTTPLASMWREIQGAGDWHDLIEPLNPLLCGEIVRYGELVAACYTAFDLDPTSDRYLNCKYGKSSILHEVGIPNSGYEVTKYIYATPDITIPTQGRMCCNRWIGYVAVASDAETKRLGRRDVLVSFRGTVTGTEWIANLMSSLTPAKLDVNNPRLDVKVESGFLNLYTSRDSSGHGSCRHQLHDEVSRIVNKYKGEEELSITLAGHSMGSSLAVLLGYDLAELGVNGDVPITVYSFGGPRVGNSRFKERCEELRVKVLRVVNVKDPVTRLPGVFFNEGSRFLMGKYELPWSCSCYAHVGVELALDYFKMANPICMHDLGTYIRLLKGKVKMVGAQNDGVGLVGKAKKLIEISAKKLDGWPWLDAAIHVGNLVQSLGF